MGTRSTVMAIAMYIPARRENTECKYTLKFRTPTSWHSSAFYIFEGRFEGSTWDESADRGYVLVGTSGQVSWGIASATVKVNGSGVSQNHALSLDTEYELEYTIPSGIYPTVNRLFSRFTNIDQFKGKAYWLKTSLTSSGTRYESKFIFTTLSASKPAGRLIFKDSSETPYPAIDRISVKTATGWSNVGGVISKTDTGSAELQLCDNSWGAATTYHIKCNVTGANASTLLKYTSSNNTASTATLVNGFNEFVIPVYKYSHLKLAATNTDFIVSDLEILDGGACGLFADGKGDEIWHEVS